MMMTTTDIMLLFFQLKFTKWWLLMKLNSTHFSVYIRGPLPVWLWHCVMLCGDQERKNSERDGNINLYMGKNEEENLGKAICMMFCL